MGTHKLIIRFFCSYFRYYQNQFKMNIIHSNENYIFIFLTTISICGTIGNSIVAFVYFQKKDKQTSSFFVLLLSINDLVICCILLPFTIYMEKIQFLTDNLYFCKTFFFLTTTIVPSSSLLMLALAFDRYFCICMVDKNIMNLHRAKIVALMLLIVGLLCGIIPGWNAKLHLVNDEHYLLNKTNGNLTEIPNLEQIINFQCLVSNNKFDVVQNFKNFYDLIYLICVILITILYALIYKEIYVRRQLKNSRKRELLLKIVMSKSNNRSYSQSFVSSREFIQASREYPRNLNKKNHLNKAKINIFANFCSMYFKSKYIRLRSQNPKNISP